MLFFVFEYMECNLYQLMKTRGKPFSETEVRNWCFQIFQALSHMHQRGYFHRDLKPGIVILHWILHLMLQQLSSVHCLLQKQSSHI